MKIKTLTKGMLAMLASMYLLSSCSTPKNIAYIQDVENAQVLETATAGSIITVQPLDKLSITVTCKDPSLAQMFNMPIVSNQHVQKASPNGDVDFRSYNVNYNDGLAAYTVSENGMIDFPVLGELKVAGMTRSELAGFIKGEIMGRGLLKDPQVTVEFLNVGISVLGEVMRPGRYDLNTDRLTLLEAISLAGDLSIQGQRENIKVLRKDGDKVRTYVVDITKTDKLLQSPAYFLKQGDIIYVEPNNIRKRQTVANGNSVTNISFWISIASLLTSAAILFKN